MSITTDMKKIRKLAVRKGTPLLVINYYGKARAFIYKEGQSTKGYVYPNMNKALNEEIRRLSG